MRKACLTALALLAALSACKREPSFDERYAGAEKAVREKASELDKDMSRRASEAASDASGVPGPVDTGGAI